MLVNYFKNLFNEDGSIKNGIILRLISLIAAIIIWTSVTNIQHPIINVKFNAHLETVNADTIEYQGKSFSIPERDAIRVAYSVKAENSGNVRQSDFRVYVNLAELTGDSGNLNVYVELLNDIQIEDYSVTPQQVRVVTDDIVYKQVPVKYNVKGNLAEGLQLGTILYSPTEVYITGPSAAIEIIEGLKFDIELSDQNDSFSDVATPYYVDRNDNRFDSPNIKRSTEVINYAVAVFSEKEVPINPVIVGGVGPSHELVETKVNPSTIILYGNKQLLDTIDSIDLPIVDVKEVDGGDYVLNENENRYESAKEYHFNVANLIPIGARSNLDGQLINLVLIVADRVVNETDTPRLTDNGEHPGPPPTEETEVETNIFGIPIIKETIAESEEGNNS